MGTGWDNIEFGNKGGGPHLFVFLLSFVMFCLYFCCVFIVFFVFFVVFLIVKHGGITLSLAIKAAAPAPTLVCVPAAHTPVCSPAISPISIVYSLCYFLLTFHFLLPVQCYSHLHTCLCPSCSHARLFPPFQIVLLTFFTHICTHIFLLLFQCYSHLNFCPSCSHVRLFTSYFPHSKLFHSQSNFFTHIPFFTHISFFCSHSNVTIISIFLQFQFLSLLSCSTLCTIDV